MHQVKNQHLKNFESSYPWTQNISLIIILILFPSSEFCSFPYINHVHVLLDLYAFLRVPI